jgi:uncharacterized membrane protein YhiD involved in acid resistance
MAVGFGRLPLAVVGTAAILVALLVFDLIEQWIGDRRDIQDYHIVTDKTDDVLDRVRTLFTNAGLGIRKRSYYEDGNSLVVHVVAMGAKAKHDKLRQTLVRSQDYVLRRS